ncbi:MAG: S9 family peptidase [Candidatus Rokubacteria bacterium]|nr:S9 family peptidase [Candidatus Rokubacteria bacterium]
MARALLLLLAALCATGPVAGCAIVPERPSPAAETQVERLPLWKFFANRDSNWGYRVSPDGTRIAWLASHSRRTTIFWKRLDDDDVRIVDTHSPRGVFWFTWARDSRHVLYTQDRDGDENYHVYLVDTDWPEKRPRDLTPFEKTRAGIHRVPKTDPHHVLIAHNRRDPTVFDLYRVDLRTGVEVGIGENPGDVLSWITDREGTLRARIRRVSATEQSLDVWEGGGGRWRTLLTLGLEDLLVFKVHDFTPDGSGMWLTSGRQRDRAALVRLDLATGAETLVYEHPGVDVERVDVSDRTGLPLAATSYPGYPEVVVFDRELEADLRRFQDGGPSGLRILSLADDERLLTLEVFSDRGSEYHLLDRRSGVRRLLGRSAMMQHAPALAPKEPVAFRSRDGLVVHGYLTRPRGAPRGPGPLVLLVHGGPWARDYWGYSDVVQLLANRGYAVLQVNYRGSTGYGRAFREAAIGEFAGKMHDDLIDGVRWAIERGIADRDRVCIMGASYGGYATLVGLTFTPDVFACGVDIVGMSSLVSLLERAPAYWKLWALPMFHRYVGDPGRPEDRRVMEARSPLFMAARVTRPLFIIHGANDPRVNLEESERMVDALRKAGKDVEYLVFREEGHTGFDWRSRMTMYRRVEEFLARHIGEGREGRR